MTDADGTEVPEGGVPVEAAAEAEKIPAWAWWTGGAALVVILMLVWAAVANATPEENEPIPEPSVTASAAPSPSPSPSPSASPAPSTTPSETAEPSETPEPEPTETDQPQPSDSPTPMPSPTDIPTPPSTFGEGKIVAGTDAAAGTYRVSAAVTEGCLWALKATGSDRGRDRVSEVLVGGIPTVTLNDGDTFSSKRCGTWNAVDPTQLFKNANAAVSAKPGVWLVGEDIRFGTWSTASLGDTNDPAKVCKWTVTETLANNFTRVVTRGVIFSGTGTVAVEAGQQFESTHCGDWTLLSK